MKSTGFLIAFPLCLLASAAIASSAGSTFTRPADEADASLRRSRVERRSDGGPPGSIAGRFDLSAEAQVLLREKPLQDRRVPQSFAFDGKGEFVYVLQLESANAEGSGTEHSARGDLVLSRLRLADGEVTGHMELHQFGHGVAMGVEQEGGAVFIWTEVDAETDAARGARGSKIGRFRFVDGATLSPSSPEIETFDPFPGGWNTTPSVDASHDRLAVRYVSPEGHWQVALYALSEFKAGRARPLRELPLPFDFGTFQGWCTFADHLYVYAGEPYGAANPTPGNATLWCLDWAAGQVVQSQRSDALESLPYREPEGLAVLTGDGAPRLCFGFGSTASAGPPRKLLSIASLSGWISPAEDLERGFVAPPAASRPSTFWWWLNNHVTREGITRNLEEFRAKGLGGVVLVNSSGGFGAGAVPAGPPFLSAEWLALFHHALKEADRLGLEVGVNLSSGWCMGGPWIKPETSGRWYLQSSIAVSGPRTFSEVLPLPGNRSGYEQARQLFIKDYVNLPLEKLDYRDTAVVAFPEPDEAAARLGEDREKALPAKSNRLDGSSHLRAREVMDPPAVRWAARPDDRPLRTSDVVDLTSRLRPDGRLDWDVPPGRWIILRTGHRMTGARTAYAAPGGEGLEVDWLSEAGVEAQFEHLGRVLLRAAGPFAGRMLRYFHEDSFEDGFPNWTATLLEKFKRSRGYDPTPYLPVFAGRIVESAEVSDRFLYDYRRTVADALADAHYGRFAELCHDAGIRMQGEGAGPSWSGTMCMDTLKNLGRSDQPMGEFWQDNYRFVQDGQNQVCKTVATAAHIYGRKTASAEAFTTFSHWSDAPSDLKPTADRAFCEGINRLVFHTSTASRPEDGKPGYEYGAGTHFNPNVTWWPLAGAWVDYVARCQHLLQSGHFVADVLYYHGDDAPNVVEPKHVPADLGEGFDYDVCNSEVLLTRLSVQEGRLVLPDGMSYRALVLPDSDRLPLEVARKIRSLVREGATVVGPRPRQAPGLSGGPQADAEVAAIGEEVWSAGDGQLRTENRFGKGRVYWGRPVRDVLTEDGIGPDFSYPAAEASLDFIHRATPDAEVYFVVNRRDSSDEVTCTFRVAGRVPERWDPVTGERRDLAAMSSDARGTSVQLRFAPRQSCFVVFRKPLQQPPPPASGRRDADWSSVSALAGPWKVRFDPKWGGPATTVFPSLVDWTLSRDEGIRYYSGAATYRITFDLPPDARPGSALALDLGGVKNMASVRLNGVELGVLWTAPWRVEITAAVKPAGNVLEIQVVNLWPNRLIGDKYLPAGKRFTRTNIPLKDDAALLPSGLLGPVVLLQKPADDAAVSSPP